MRATECDRMVSCGAGKADGEIIVLVFSIRDLRIGVGRQ